jgi:hypothetical protein
MQESQILASAANNSTAPLTDPPSESADLAPEPDLASHGVESLGFESPGAQPTADSTVQDLLVYGLIPHETRRPDLAIILGVAAELEAITAFAEGPMQVAFELLSRRLRAAVELSKRMMRSAEAQTESA